MVTNVKKPGRYSRGLLEMKHTYVSDMVLSGSLLFNAFVQRNQIGDTARRIVETTLVDKRRSKVYYVVGRSIVALKTIAYSGFDNAQ